MAWNNNNYRQNNNYRLNYYGNQNQQPPKRSGATYSKIQKGKFKGATIVNAWNVSKSKGMLTCVVAPYKGSKKVTSEAGHEYQLMMAVLTYKNSGVEKQMPVLMNVKTKVIVLEELGMCITPNGRGRTSSGKNVTGYFGAFNK